MAVDERDEQTGRCRLSTLKARRLRHRGFLFLFGQRRYSFRNRAEKSVKARCPMCRQAAKLLPMQSRVYFHIWFIPIAPLSEATFFTRCSDCKAELNLSIDRIKANAPDGDSFASAIALFNRLRESPADSGMLLKLMEMYDRMGEAREAMSAARTFPAAMAGCGKCQAILSRLSGSGK